MNQRANLAMQVIYAGSIGLWGFYFLRAAVVLAGQVPWAAVLVTIAIFVVGLVAVSLPQLRQASVVHWVFACLWLVFALGLLSVKRGFAFRTPTFWVAAVLGVLHVIQATSKRQVGSSPEGNEPTPAGTSPAS